MVMAAPPPDETVRLLFEARRAGDTRRVDALLHPDARHAFSPGSRLEVHAHRIERDGDAVVVHGRVREVTDGAITDSPAAWRFEVRDGIVQTVTPLLPSNA